ncbi:MAG: hypothetical protein KA319_03215 [Ferruginibacter sp.]|nr:hypothetical protein [Ferruginibacter sp.]
MNNNSMIKNFLTITVAFLFLVSCEKELSTENSTVGSELIVGKDCRISKLVYTDTATKLNLGSIAAAINILDRVDDITVFDSLAQALTFSALPTYSNDTVYLNPDEYFVMDIINNRVKKLHGLTDPTDILSPQFDADYVYDANGFLIQKNYNLTIGNIPAIKVDYTYTGNNPTKMVYTNLISNQVEMDATMQYHSNIIPRSYLYVFPDEFTHSQYLQFYNYGRKPANAIKDIKLYFYNGTATPVDSLVSKFDSYRMSRDNYVLDVIMSGDEQPGIPAFVPPVLPPAIGGVKIKFSYKCK